VATTQTAGDNSTKVATTAYVNAITGTSGLNGFKNRIINGAMVIDQRNAGASVTPTTSGTYTLDRWNSFVTQSSKLTIQQNAGAVTPPAGFTNYLGVTSSSAYSVISSDIFQVSQFIEGYNIADLEYGTANAKTITLSFWVRSSLTGTFGGALSNSAYAYSYPYTYTISAANTWEYKTITITGATSGTWLTTNGIGIRVYFGLGIGSTNSGSAGSWSANGYASATGATSVVGTNGATFYITGVQLEKGSTATSFDYRPFGTELQLCQRYFEMYQSGTVFLTKLRESTRDRRGNFYYKVPKRVSATLTIITSNADGGGAVGGSSGIDGGNFESLSTSDSQTPFVQKFSGSAEL
jgi:hypothetical protein